MFWVYKFVFKLVLKLFRKRLGLPDDEFISTRKYAALQKRVHKLNERLKLKLRASEEIRLQLQLDKNSLK